MQLATRLGMSETVTGLTIVAVGTSMPGAEFPAQIASFDNFVMVGVSILLLVFLRTGFRLSRVEGGVFVVLYAVYVGYLIAMAGG